MFEQKLKALQYDKSFNIDDEEDYKSLIFWLENMKIRFYPPADRNSLMPQCTTWKDALNKYLDEIGFSYNRDNKAILDWLLNLALQYEMEDTRTQVNMSREEVSTLPMTNISTDYSSIDVNSPVFLSELKYLSSVLNVPYYEAEPLITLRAIAILLRRLKKSTLSQPPRTQESASQSKKKKLTNHADESILNRPFGNTSKYDSTLNRCANVLRLLYINDLRDLQTQVNNMVVQVQAITANPKTDTTLGKVGR